jgi:AcrR family transcriptional regulator
MKDTPKRAHEPWKAFQARQRNQDTKRDAVLQTAAHMFLEQGYRRTSMSELAKRLQITKPALYYYFRNKEEILVECYRAGITLIETLLDKALVSRGTGLDKVKVYIEAYAKSVVLHDFGRCVSMLDENELSPETRKLVRALKRRIDASIRAYIEEGIADKSITPCDPKLASFAMSGAINWIGTWYKPTGPLSGPEIASHFSFLLTEGLRARASASRRNNKTPLKPAKATR